MVDSPLIPSVGAEPFMHTLLQRLEGDMAMNLSSLQFLKLDPSVRSRAAEALVPVSKMKVTPDIIRNQVYGGSQSAFRICYTSYWLPGGESLLLSARRSIRFTPQVLYPNRFWG